MKTLIAPSLAILLTAASAGAVEPVGAEDFNIDPGFDLAGLTRDNFYEVVVPLAKAEGTLTFFDFTNSFGPLFSDHLIPAFEEAYGITVDYVRGENDAAVQQLLAAHNAGSPAPADAYFVSSGRVGTLLDGGVIANLPLHALLPEAATLEPAIATVTQGFDHGGAYLPFHRNQTSIVYDTRAVPADEVPQDLDALLAWAKANPGRLVVTSPKGGGSGSGFLQSIAYAKVTDERCRDVFADWSMTAEKAAELAGADCMDPVWDYYRALLPVVELANGNSDTLNLIATGAGTVGTAWEDMAYDFMGRGLLPPTIRQQILASGQVGGGDGMFVAADATHPAAALLFLDFMVSAEVQLKKLQLNGSRTARTDIDPAGTFTADQIQRLIPTDQFASRALPGMPNALNTALADHFVAEILRSN